jgi:hypothetical protein
MAATAPTAPAMLTWPSLPTAPFPAAAELVVAGAVEVVLAGRVAGVVVAGEVVATEVVVVGRVTVDEVVVAPLVVLVEDVVPPVVVEVVEEAFKHEVSVPD